MYEYKRAAFGLGQGAPVYAESSIESGIPGVVEARQITPTGAKGPLIPVDTDFARPIGRRGPLVPYATEYARRIGRHGPKGRLIPLGTEGVGGLFGARAEIRELRQTINNLIDRVRSGSAGARQDLQAALQHHDVTEVMGVAMPQRLVAAGVPQVDWQGLQETLRLGRAVAAGEDIASSGNGSRQPVLNRGWLVGVAGGALALGVLVTLWVKRGQ